MTLQRIAIALVAGLVMALLCGPFPEQLEVNADSERDLFRTLALTEQGIFPTQGPAIDFLPIHLGPGWYLSVAPALLVDRNPEAIHTFHSFLFVLSLIALFFALRTRAGPWVAVMTCLLLGTSHHTAQVMVRLWHNGLFPAVSVFWFVLLHRTLQDRPPRSRNRNWIGAWLLTALLLQLHAVACVYAVTLFAVHARSLRRDGLPGGWSGKVAVAIPALLVAAYGWGLASINWGQVRTISSGRGHEGFAIGAVVEKLPEHCWSAWTSPDLHWIAYVVLSLSLWGAVRSMWNARQSWGFRQWVLIQVSLGFLAVSWLAGLHPEARYFNALIPGIYILMAYGIHDITRWIPASIRGWVGSGPIVLLGGMAVVVWGGVACLAEPTRTGR